MGDLTKSKKTSMSSMTENYTMGVGRSTGSDNESSKTYEHCKVDGLSDMTENLSVSCSEKTPGKKADMGFYGHMGAPMHKSKMKLPGMGRK